MSKTNLGLVDHAKMALAEKWGYVFGTYGKILTDVILERKLKQYPKDIGGYKTFIQKNWIGKRTADCVGLIKSFLWWDNGEPVYDENTDVSADGMLENAKVKGDIKSVPDIPGLCVWKKGHIGVYIGNGKVIESKGTKYGVVQTPLKGFGSTPWTHWLECPYIEYIIPKTPNEITIDNAQADKAIGSKEFWLNVLEGKTKPNPISIKNLIDNYHGLLEELKKKV